MGLDLHAYEHVQLVKPMTDLIDPSTGRRARRVDIERPGHVLLEQTRGFTQNDKMPNGLYKTRGRKLEIQAGSYAWYSDWRDELARLAGTKTSKETGPFAELLRFVDDYGFVGPGTSCKLAGDFARYRRGAELYVPRSAEVNPREFLEVYKGVQKAFKLACKTGVVEFS